MKGRTAGGRVTRIAFSFAAVLLVISGATSFAAGSSESAGKTAATSINLTLAGSQEFHVPSSWAFYQPNIQAFEAKNPGVKVRLLLLPDAQTTQTLQTQLATGEPSDIMFYNKVSAENELDAQTNMVDLSSQPWVGRLKEPSILTAPNGKIYGYSPVIDTGAQGIAYNVDIFKKLGLSIPTTYQQLISVCETLKANGITPFYGPFKDVWTFQIWTTDGWGVYASKKDPGVFQKINKNEVKWADVPAFLEILARGDELIKKGFFQPTMLSDDYNGAPAAFASGKYAMMIIASPFVNDMAQKDPSLHLGLFPFPIFDDPAMNIPAQSQLGPLFFIPKKAKHITEAEKFIDFLSQPAQIAAVNTDPARTFLPNFVDIPAPHLQPVNQYLYDNYIKTGKVAVEANAFVKVDLNDLWKYYQDMIAGAMTPKQVLQAWDRKFEELMKSKGYPGF